MQKPMKWECTLFITRIYLKLYFPFLRSSHQRCSVKKVFSEISQNSQLFSVNFVKFLRKPFHTERLWWALLFPDILSDCYWLFNPLAFFKHIFTTGFFLSSPENTWKSEVFDVFKRFSDLFRGYREMSDMKWVKKLH